jgi:TATA-binding protein-associated factor Taf7
MIAGSGFDLGAIDNEDRAGESYFIVRLMESRMAAFVYDSLVN